jgi:hypothetical protein
VNSRYPSRSEASDILTSSTGPPMRDAWRTHERLERRAVSRRLVLAPGV